MTETDTNAVRWLCKLMRLYDTPKSEKQPAPEFPRAKERRDAEDDDIHDVPGD